MNSLDIQSVTRQSLLESVVGQLMDLLINGSLKSGDKLPSEAALAAQFGVSKPVVREALRELNALGMVQIRQGKISTVRSLAPEPLQHYLNFATYGRSTGLREALELRQALEAETAALAASRIEPGQVEELKQITVRMAEHLHTQDQWVDADVGFHVFIAKCAQNKLMLYMTEALSDILRTSIGMLHAQKSLRDSQATLKRHVDIADAIAARDPEAAKAAMIVHFAATKPVLLALTDQDR